ncbi:MAG TPA: hypothetical protein VHL11_17575, partial [Phototrophicaceae bacterium]|nr:hypothetical protein [Phototrophicaceae bacterium]
MTKIKLFVSGGLILLFTLGLLASLPSTPAAAQIAPTATPTATLTATIRPSPTPSTTPLPGLELPDWISDPDTDVVVLFAYDEFDHDDSDEGITFINAVTDERFILKSDYRIHDVGWVKATDGVYIQLKRYQSSGADNSDGFNEYVHLATGKLERFAYGEPGAPLQISTPEL